jgi:hypothetical protein
LENWRIGERGNLGTYLQVSMSHIRLISSIAHHSLVISHSLKPKRQSNIHRPEENNLHKLLNEFHHILLSRKRDLHIQLSKFGLTISSQILISEALGKLKVTSDTGSHQNLLVLLRRLGKSVGVTLVPGGDQEFTSSLRSGLEEKGGLDFKESHLLETMASDTSNDGTQSQSCRKLGVGTKLQVTLLRGENSLGSVNQGRIDRVELDKFLQNNLGTVSGHFSFPSVNDFLFGALGGRRGSCGVGDHSADSDGDEGRELKQRFVCGFLGLGGLGSQSRYGLDQYVGAGTEVVDFQDAHVFVDLADSSDESVDDDIFAGESGVDLVNNVSGVGVFNCGISVSGH